MKGDLEALLRRVVHHNLHDDIPNLADRILEMCQPGYNKAAEEDQKNLIRSGKLGVGEKYTPSKGAGMKNKEFQSVDTIAKNLIALRDDLSKKCLGRAIGDPETRILLWINTCLYRSYEPGDFR